MGRFIEAFFRHKLLLLTPPVLISAAVTAWTLMTAPVFYDSTASVWVDRPAYLANNNSDWNTYIGPAQNQSVRLNELLHTQSFLNDIGRRTVLAPLVTTPKGQERVSALIGNGLVVAANGHVLMLRMRSENAQLSNQVLTAVVAAFKDSVATDRISQATLATSFYEARLKAADDELGQLTSDVRQYLAANPRLGGISDPRGLPAGLQAVGGDPQILDMQRRLESKQAEVDGLRRSLDQARLDASASLESQELGFQVVDAPTLATTGGRDLKKRAIVPAAALVLSLGLSAGLLMLLSLMDRSVRTEADVTGLARVIGDVPYLRPRRIPRAFRSVAARRAIGFVAGAALPAPRGAR